VPGSFEERRDWEADPTNDVAAYAARGPRSPEEPPPRESMLERRLARVGWEEVSVDLAMADLHAMTHECFVATEHARNSTTGITLAAEDITIAQLLDLLCRPTDLQWSAVGECIRISHLAEGPTHMIAELADMVSRGTSQECLTARTVLSLSSESVRAACDSVLERLKLNRPPATHADAGPVSIEYRLLDACPRLIRDIPIVDAPGGVERGCMSSMTLLGDAALEVLERGLSSPSSWVRLLDSGCVHLWAEECTLLLSTGGALRLRISQPAAGSAWAVDVRFRVCADDSVLYSPTDHVPLRAGTTALVHPADVAPTDATREARYYLLIRVASAPD
jgi:hypothetical protein